MIFILIFLMDLIAIADLVLLREFNLNIDGDYELEKKLASSYSWLYDINEYLNATAHWIFAFKYF